MTLPGMLARQRHATFISTSNPGYVKYKVELSQNKERRPRLSPADAPSGQETIAPYGSTATTFLTVTALEFAEQPLAVVVPTTRRFTANSLPT